MILGTILLTVCAVVLGAMAVVGVEPSADPAFVKISMGAMTLALLCAFAAGTMV